MEKSNQSACILFKAEDEKISVDVRFNEEKGWLTQMTSTPKSKQHSAQ